MWEAKRACVGVTDVRRLKRTHHPFGNAEADPDHLHATLTRVSRVDRPREQAYPPSKTISMTSRRLSFNLRANSPDSASEVRADS